MNITAPAVDSCIRGSAIPDIAMIIRLTLVLAALSGCPQLAAATTGKSTAPAPESTTPHINTLLSGLSDESFHVREQSTHDLWKLGEAALPALREAAASADPEKAVRARDLLRKIQLHITPDTDPSVTALVEAYHKATPAQKTSLMGKMRGKRAWLQMLKLYAAETNDELRERLRPGMAAVAIKAARERLMLDDAQGAREFLEMAPADNQGLLALAEFHRHHGTLQKQLDQAAAGDAKSAAWRLALQRAAGNPAAARGQAIAAGEPAIAAVMATLAGDPLPFLRQQLQNNPDEHPAQAIYARIAAERWQERNTPAAESTPLIRLLSSPNRSARDAAVSALFSLGEVETAEPVFLKSRPLDAFRHFDALERIPDALRALNLDPAKPDFDSWVRQTLERWLNQDAGDQVGVSDEPEQLVTVANFLERRGLHDTALQAFGAPLAAMAGNHPDDFKDFLGSLFGGRDVTSGAPRLALAVGSAWAGDDQERWEEIHVAAFGQDERNPLWAEWITEIQPDAGHAGRLQAMLALSGMGRDPESSRTRWMDRLWHSLDKAQPAPREDRIRLLAELAADTGDVANCLKALDQLPPASREKIFWGMRIVHLTAAERWNDAADLILNQILTLTEAKHEPSADLHAYAAATLRAAGRHKEALEHDRRADLMTLGNAMTAIRAGNGYALGRDYQRAADWWRRAAMLADPSSEEFPLAMKLHADALLEQHQWPECAAISELIAAIHADSHEPGEGKLPLMRHRLQADMTRALSRLGNNRARSLAILARCHQRSVSDGSLADFFFPALRHAGLLREHDAWFNDTWRNISNVITRYPDSDNTRNTAAWFAARALRQLDAAEQHIRHALAANPGQAAYLDTMAEIQFAHGRRAKALEWSQLAVGVSPEDTMLRRQRERFRSAPPPR
jgi:tetratricopeptide (TPR) repeat protein